MELFTLQFVQLLFRAEKHRHRNLSDFKPTQSFSRDQAEPPAQQELFRFKKGEGNLCCLTHREQLLVFTWGKFSSHQAKSVHF